jgi:hypothetical protein
MNMARHLNRPAEEITLPISGEEWGAATVIAAAWPYISRHKHYIVLISEPKGSGYAVIHFDPYVYKTTGHERFSSIGAAVEFYEEIIGGH